MQALSHQTKAAAKSLTILQRLAQSDTTAIQDCVDAYGKLIWALARKYADSPEKAETATEEIFLDIWRYAERFDPTKLDEPTFILLIARRQLIKRLQ